MFFKALILICATSLSPADCTEDSALAVIQGPDTQNPVMCALHSMALLASLAEEFHPNAEQFVKPICRRAPLPPMGLAEKGN